MPNHISNAFKQVRTWPHFIFANTNLAKVVRATEKNPNVDPLRKAMKQIHLFVPTALNSGEPVTTMALHSVENLIRDAFGGCTLHPHLLGAWASEEGIPYRDPILLVEIEVEDSPTLLSSLMPIVRFICDQFDQEAIFLTIADVGVLSVRRDALATL